MHFLCRLRTTQKSALPSLHSSTGRVQAFPFTFLRLVKHDYQKRTLYGWLALCLCLSDIRGHFGNCVLRRSGRSLKKKEGISTLLHLPCNQERCPSFGRSSLCLYCAALFINGRSRVKTSCLRQPLTRPVLSVLVELVSVAMFPIQGFLYTP